MSSDSAPDGVGIFANAVPILLPKSSQTYCESMQLGGVNMFKQTLTKNKLLTPPASWVTTHWQVYPACQLGHNTLTGVPLVIEVWAAYASPQSTQNSPTRRTCPVNLANVQRGSKQFRILCAFLPACQLCHNTLTGVPLVIEVWAACAQSSYLGVNPFTTHTQLFQKYSIVQ